MRPKLKPRWRRCLRCNKRFQSEGPWNRLCTRCNALNKDVKAPPSAAPRWNGRPMRGAAQLDPKLPKF
jgi:hypothetical protein